MDERELNKMFDEDQTEDQEASLDNLGQLSKLAERQMECQAEVAELENKLAMAKEKLKGVQEIDIPNLMMEMGIKSFKLNNGASLSIKSDIFASIRSDHLDEGLQFFEDLGCGGIIKDDVTVKFGKGDSDKAAQVMNFCRTNGYNATEKKHIHPQTLKAEIKQQMERGVDFPDEIFSITPFNKAIIKLK